MFVCFITWKSGCSYTHSLARRTDWLTHSSIHSHSHPSPSPSLNRASIHLLIDLVIHSYTYSLIHSSVHSTIYFIQLFYSHVTYTSMKSKTCTKQNNNGKIWVKITQRWLYDILNAVLALIWITVCHVFGSQST